MKILIFGFTKIKYMPYMHFYLDNLDKEKNEIHLVYWNRDEKEENTDELKNVALHEFSFYQQDEANPLTKIKGFWKYRKFAIKKIKEIQPDFIIVMHTLPGVLINRRLAKKYDGKYILDYRDSTFEKFGFFQRIVHRLSNHSKATFVSSDAFRRFLPKEKKEIYTSHNILEDSLLHRDEKNAVKKGSEKIRLAFWGFIRHEEINRAIIEKIAKDSRFELHYYGREQQTAENLKAYVAELAADNVFFHGEYVPHERYEFVKNTDIIHNLYDDANTLYAMGNKYYDGIIFRVPQVCMAGSFMGEQVAPKGLGFSLNPYEEDFTEQLYQQYTGLDKEKFEKCCDEELIRVLEEYNFGKEYISALR